MPNFDYGQLTRLHEIRVEQGAPQFLNDMLTECERRYIEAREDVQRKGQAVIARVEVAQRNAIAGMHLNDTGEIQSAGPTFDLACATYQRCGTDINRYSYAIRQYWHQVMGASGDELADPVNILNVDSHEFVR